MAISIAKEAAYLSFKRKNKKSENNLKDELQVPKFWQENELKCRPIPKVPKVPIPIPKPIIFVH
jgi:hypothetical protein